MSGRARMGSRMCLQGSPQKRWPASHPIKVLVIQGHGTDMLEDQIQQGVQQGLLGGVATRRRAFGVS